MKEKYRIVTEDGKEILRTETYAGCESYWNACNGIYEDESGAKPPQGGQNNGKESNLRINRGAGERVRTLFTYDDKLQKRRARDMGESGKRTKRGRNIKISKCTE